MVHYNAIALKQTIFIFYTLIITKSVAESQRKNNIFQIRRKNSVKNLHIFPLRFYTGASGVKNACIYIAHNI